MKYVVVTFGSDAEGWCDLNRCPMEAIEVKDRAEGIKVMEQYAAFEPHFLMVLE